MKKLGIMCLVFILAIGCLGTAYGYWSSILTINTTAAAGNWNNGQFQSATAGLLNPSMAGTFTMSPAAGTWPAGMIVINGTGPNNNSYAWGSIISYTIQNNGSIPIKINTVSVSISGTMGNLHVYDTTSGDPLSNFDYTNRGSGGAAGATTVSAYTNPIPVGGTVSGHIYLVAPPGSGVNGKNCTVTVTFSSKAFTQ